jgi:hypothetical protein
MFCWRTLFSKRQSHLCDERRLFFLCFQNPCGRHPCLRPRSFENWSPVTENTLYIVLCLLLRPPRTDIVDVMALCLPAYLCPKPHTELAMSASRDHWHSSKGSLSAVGFRLYKPTSPTLPSPLHPHSSVAKPNSLEITSCSSPASLSFPKIASIPGMTYYLLAIFF